MNRIRQARADPKAWIETEGHKHIQKRSKSWGRRLGLKLETVAEVTQESNLVLLTMAVKGTFPPPEGIDWHQPVNVIVELCSLKWQHREIQTRTRNPSIDNLGGRPCPDKQTTTSHERLDLDWALNQLNEDEKRLVCDRFWGQKSLEQIAAHNGCSVATAHRRIKEVINKLHSLLL